jgi:predicted kinase
MTTQVWLVRGIPGSGKSTMIEKKFGPSSRESVVLSTDDYWYAGGHYLWDNWHLEDAHDWTHRRFMQLLERQVPRVIVANTFTRLWEMTRFVEMARTFDAQLRVIESDASWAKDPVECAKRTKTGVTVEKLQRMLERWENIPSSQAMEQVLAARK